MSDNLHVVGKGIDIYNAVVLSKSGREYDEADLSPLMCNHCNFLLRDVYQLLGCGHRYCKECVYVAIGSDRKCPKDDDPEVVEDTDIKPDRACLRELSKLLARCKGCQWEGKLLEIEEHFQGCMEIEIFCSNGCRKKVVRKDMLDHKKICTFRIILCDYCKQEIRFNEMKNHVSVCDSVPVPCEKCNEEVTREKLKEHQLSWCRENVVECSFENCLFKGKVYDMRTHYKTHLHELFKVLQISSQQKKILITHLKKAVDELDELYGKTRLCSKQMNQMKDNLLLVEDLTAKISQLQNEISATKRRIGQRSIQADSSGPTFMDNDELRSLGNRIVKLEQDVLVMRPSIEDAQQTYRSFHDQIVGYVEVVQTIKEAVSRHTVSMDEVRLRQDILDVKTVNGVFVWKIPEISRRHREAKEKRTLSLYSPPFHTSPHGYRMCIRSYLNGDGSGKDVYISVFFVLMKSEHDDTLTWPFRRPVTFELVSQANKTKTISETFMPDEMSPSFQKPTKEMNVASGFPKFAKQSLLKENNGFVKDDSIFIRCKVDVSGLQCE